MPPRKNQAAAPVNEEALEEGDKLTPEEQAQLDAEDTDTSLSKPPPPPAEPEGGELKPLGKKHEKAIPYERFDELNVLNKELKRQLDELNPVREKWARLEERQKVAAEQRAAQEAAEAEAKRQREQPDPEIDPVGYRLWHSEQTTQQLLAQNQQFQQQLNQFMQQRAAVDQNTDMNMWLNSQVPLARSLVPDYDNRVDFARATRTGMWSHVYDLPDGRKIQLFNPEDAAKITEGEEVVLTTRARMMGIPLHMVVNTLADLWGYKGAANGNGTAPRQVTGQLMPSGSERLEQIQRGQAVQGLGRTQSGESPAAQGWQTMSNEEFKLFVGNMGEDQYIEMVRDPRFGKQFERRVSMIDMVE
jgi:hypothetical protein